MSTVSVRYIVDDGGRTLPDGRRPVPGGWNRIHLIVEDVPREVERVRKPGCRFGAISSPARRSSGDGEVMFRSNHPEFRLLERPRHERVLCLGAL